MPPAFPLPSHKVLRRRADELGIRAGVTSANPSGGFVTSQGNRRMTTTTAPMAPPAGPPDPQLFRIRDLVYQVAGIFQPDNKLKMLEDRIGRRMQALGVKTLRDYYDCLTIKPIRQAELISLLNEITIGETCFFRNLPQLDAVRNVVLPHILEARAKIPVKNLRIWSAGCSTGEEPYTLSMILLEETATKLKGWNFEIMATDLNERSLVHCKHGVYGKYSTRNLTAYYRHGFNQRLIHTVRGVGYELRAGRAEAER